MPPARWEATVGVLKDQGVLKGPVQVDQLYTNRFVAAAH
jgi:hypothetical protein